MYAPDLQDLGTKISTLESDSDDLSRLSNNTTRSTLDDAYSSGTATPTEPTPDAQIRTDETGRARTAERCASCDVSVSINQNTRLRRRGRGPRRHTDSAPLP